MHLIRVCTYDRCRSRFSEDSLKAAERELGIKAGESTADQKFKLETCGCLGGCNMGPNVFFGKADSPLSMLSGEVKNKMLPHKLTKEIQILKSKNS